MTTPAVAEGQLRAQETRSHIVNSQPPGRMAQVINRADATPSTQTPLTTVDQTNTSAWDAWQSRGDALAHDGRLRALLTFGLVVTGLVLFYVVVG